MTSLIGRRLGRYEIRAEIGRGGMARVFSALDTQLQRTVALKVLAAQLSLDEEFVRRFEREARTAASLRHPAIVTVYDVGEQDGLYFIAMEYVAGRSLHTILEERTALGLGFAVSVLEPVAQALDYAHSQGAVHRDIKPHNILIDRAGRVLLTDFGIAQTTDADSERLTRTGVFMGTPEYISPEQAEARRVDGRSDLYSLGVVAYEVVTGRVPFAGATPQLIVAHAQLPPPPPTSVAAYLPSELDEVLTKSLAKRPERRYPSGASLVAALRGVAERYGTPLASRDQLAALAVGQGAEGGARAGGDKARGVQGERPRQGQAAGPSERPIPPAERVVPPAPRAAPPTERQAPPVERVAPPAERPAPAGERQAPRTGPTRPSAPRPAPGGSGPRPPAPRTTGRPAYPAEEPRRRRAASGGVPVLVIGVVLVALTLALIFVAARGLANPLRFPTPRPTLAQPSPILVGTLNAVSPTSPPPSITPTDTPAPTFTPAVLTPLPTLEPTLPPPPPPPTRGPTSPPPPPPPSITPTDTAVPETPTDTTAPPSETPTDTTAPPSETPTDTATITLTPTNTPLPETPVISETAQAVTPIITPGGGAYP